MFCYNCHSELPNNAKFCHHCGREQSVRVIYPLDYLEIRTIPNQLRVYFFADLRNYLHRELDPAYEGECLDLMSSTDFRDVIDNTILEIAQQIEEWLQGSKTPPLHETDYLIGTKFYAILDLFFIHYVPHLLPCRLSDKILMYHDTPLRDINLREMILQYLDLDSEEETWYTNIIEIPVPKLQQAIKSWLYYDSTEVPLIFCDQTLLGNGKAGFSFTDKSLYWKAHFHKPSAMRFRETATIVRKGKNLLINGAYFSVNPSINFKVFKLLLKIQMLQ